MKLLAIIVGLLLPATVTAAAADDLRGASMVEIRAMAPRIPASEVQLLSIPPLLAPLQGVVLHRATYRLENREWQLQLRCIPNRACLPFLAVVHSDDPSLFRNTYDVRTAAPLVRAGDRKQISVISGGVRLRQYVTCLQSGRSGDTIRVRAEPSHGVLLATVTPDGNLVARRPK